MFGRKRKLDDFTSEIEAHIQLEVERLREQGLSEEEARAAARRSFGNVMRVEERFYETGHWMWWDHLLQDIRYAAHVAASSGLHHHRRTHHRIRHRSHDGDLQRGGCRAVARPAVPATGAARKHRG